MQLKSIKREIAKLGGSVTSETEKRLSAEVNGYDVEWCGSGFLTIRAIKNRGHFDAGSDYNPGNYLFINKIKHIAEYTK
jgi:hypothetical protein